MIGIEMCGVPGKWLDVNESASNASMPNHTT